MQASEHKIARAISSVKWLIFWICLALAFNFIIYFSFGFQRAQEFFGGYITELSLSIDNVFVFLMIFSSFGVGEHAQHRVLKWGIIGAIVLRFVFIICGVALINNFEWILWLFGIFLIIQGIRMFASKEEQKDPHDTFLVKTISKAFPVSKQFVGEKFFVTVEGKHMLTPLFVVLLSIEFSDILFAIDSVPAVLSISTDIFVVYTSNIFAILGLRQLFFVIEHASEKFELVKYGISIILAFTGIKMLLGAVNFHISTAFSIIFILICLILSITLSIFYQRKKGQ